MKKAYLIFVLFIGVCFTGVGQNLNSYKYVVIPEKFDFLKESNQYQMNELAKFLFEKYGFSAFMASELKPSDISMDPCNTLYADVKDDSGLLQTKLQVLLKDCRNNIVFTSEEGKSREKDFKKAYQEALRAAFKYVQTINYTYSENTEKQVESIPVVNTPKPSVEKEVEEVIVSAIPKELSKKPEAVSVKAPINRTEFTSGSLEFYLIKTDFGFQLFQSQMEEPFAKLIKTNSEGYFIYSTISINGIAFFDASGNLNVEVLAVDGNSTSTKIYKLKN